MNPLYIRIGGQDNFPADHGHTRKPGKDHSEASGIIDRGQHLGHITLGQDGMIQFDGAVR